jgi:hypothetical protein
MIKYQLPAANLANEARRTWLGGKAEAPFDGNRVAFEHVGQMIDTCIPDALISLEVLVVGTVAGLATATGVVLDVVSTTGPPIKRKPKKKVSRWQQSRRKQS